MKTLAFLLLFTAVSGQQKFHAIRHWKYVNFTWPGEEVYRSATAQGLYVPENNVIAGVKYFEGYYYITLPRMKPGVPATLTRIKAGPPDRPSPWLEPYPSWQMNGVEDCNNLQNVQSVEIDPEGQMWVVDGGRINTLTAPVVRCPPKLVIFDIKGNRTTTVYVFPEDVAAKNGSFLFDIVVDNTDAGYAYITDNSARDPGIIVFSRKENRSWKIRHAASMMADPSASQFTVNGITISAPINVAGIALGPKIHTSNSKVVVNEDREVYFSPISSLHLYSINTTVLRTYPPPLDLGDSIKDVGVKSSQGGAMIMDNQGVLYFALLQLNAVGKWDSHTPFETGQKLIARDQRYLEWPSSFAFDLSGNLTVVSNKLNRFISGRMDLNEYNFALITAHVEGRSYLYDGNFNYETEGRTEPVSSTKQEPVPSSKPVTTVKPEPVPNSEPVTTPEPVPNPKPEPEPKSNSEPHQGEQSSTTERAESSATIRVLTSQLLILSLSLLF